MDAANLLLVIVFALFSGVSFVIGSFFGARLASRHQPVVKTVEIPKPFVVEKEVVREVTTPGFVYPPAGTPNPAQEMADRKIAEIISDPEL